MTLTIDVKFEECFKNDKNLVKFDLSTRNLKNLHFHLSLLCKVFNVWPKKVQRSYLLWQWRVMHNLKKNWLVVWKWNEEYGKFSLEHLIVSKFGLSWDPLIKSRKSMSLKFTEELRVMTVKNYAKFEEEMICFKDDMRILTNFDPSTWMSQKFSL